MSKIAVWKINPNLKNYAGLEIVPLDPPPASLNSASRIIPGGVYTTFRTFEGKKILPLQDHLRRLEESASLVDSPVSLDQQTVQNALHKAVQAFPAMDSRVRLTVDLEKDPGTVYIALEPLQTPSPQDYEIGVITVTIQLHRQNPEAKQTSFINTAESIRSELPREAYEGLLVDVNHEILEGLSSNFFAVKHGEIWTAETGVLPGITRSMVLEAARRENIPVRLHSVSVFEIPNLQEAFLTSSSRCVLPIRQIDQTPIGDGRPGSITRTLASAYWEEIRRNLVEV